MTPEKAYWRYYAGEAKRGQSPLYWRLASAIADDPELQELASRSRAGQPHANMIFGAVQFLLFKGAQHRLRDFWPSVTAQIAPGDPYPVFKDFCRAFEQAIIGIIATLVTNTNETGRCVHLFPAFGIAAGQAKRPLHMIELGPSAGLNLYWDEYRYRYVRANGSAIEGGAKVSPVLISTELRGKREPPVPREAPRVASRIGIELHPIDLSEADDRLWLRALIWPERADRFARFDAAADIALKRGKPPIVAGDAVEALPDVLSRVPESEPVCVYHSQVVYQIPQPRQAMLDAAMEEASRARPVFRVASEWDGEAYPLTLTAYHRGHGGTRLLSIGDPHGSWIEWRGE